MAAAVVVVAVVLSVNESILNLRNRSKCSVVAFDHIYRIGMVLLSELERRSSYYATVIDGCVYLQNDERTSCTLKNHKSFEFELQEPIKVFNGSIVSYLSNIDSLVV